jgi:hypothetical protein
MSFIFKDKNIVLPTPYPRVKRKLKTAHTSGWNVVGDFKLRDKIDLMPNVGMQESYCCCEANLIFICGEATGGKTYGMMLKVLYGIDKPGFSSVLVSTRLQDSRKGGSIFRDTVEVIGKFNNCEYTASDYPTFRFEKSNTSHRLIHSNFNTDNPQERADFIEYAKKNQNSLQQFDEANDLSEFMFLYWISRNRDSSGMIPQTALSFNPDHNNYTTTMLVDAGYIGEDWFIKPNMDGKMRYFYAAGDHVSDFIWGDTPEEVAAAANITISEKDRKAGVTYKDIVKSFVCYASSAGENRELVSATQGQSISNLHAVGKTQRAIVKGGYFGPTETAENNISRQAINNLWENPISDDNTMYATMDISSGRLENDKCPMIIWRGDQMIAIEFFSGEPESISPWIKDQLTHYRIDIRNFAYDATGHGYWMQGLTEGIPITWNKRVMQEYDANGNPITVDEYYNLRSQLLGKTEVMIKSGMLSCAIPKDKRFVYGRKGETRRFIDVLYDEIDLFITLKKNKKTYYRSTDEFKARYKFSPDIMTTIALKAVFNLDLHERKKPAIQVADDAYDALYSRPKGRVRFSRFFK